MHDMFTSPQYHTSPRSNKCNPVAVSPLVPNIAFVLRLEADLTMLMSFGDGKERDETQMQVLLTAAGFTPGRLLPSTGLMAIQEAAPTPAPAAAAALTKGAGQQARKNKHA